MTVTRKIVVIDDDEDLLQAVCDVLGDVGHQTVPFSGAEAALASLDRDNPPDLILLDLMMPGMSGWDFREAQRSQPGLSSIPVVVMTASRNLSDNPIDANEVLLKPLNLELLLGAIARHGGGAVSG